MTAEMSADIQFIRKVGKWPFIVIRKRDGYRSLVAAAGAGSAEARAAVLAEHPEEEFVVIDA